MAEKTKYVRVSYNSFVWTFPAYLIAKDRAQYYVRNDKETTYADEYDFVINDNFELKNWFLGDMNWEDVSKYARLEKQPFELQPVLSESDIEVYEKEE